MSRKSIGVTKYSHKRWQNLSYVNIEKWHYVGSRFNDLTLKVYTWLVSIPSNQTTKLYMRIRLKITFWEPNKPYMSSPHVMQGFVPSSNGRQCGLVVVMFTWTCRSRLECHGFGTQKVAKRERMQKPHKSKKVL